MMSHFSDRLRVLRKEAGLSQPQLAEQLGLSRSTVAMYESGEREPSHEVLQRIALLLHTDVNELLGFEAPASVRALKLALFEDADAPDSMLHELCAYAAFLKSRYQPK